MINLNGKTLELLEDIERRIDPTNEENYKAQWEDFLSDRFEGEIFSPQRRVKTAPQTRLPKININDAIEDYELMLVSEFAQVSRNLDSDQLLVARSNYGSAIIASLFGAEIFVMPYETNTLPTARSFNNTDQIRQLLDKGIPDLNAGFGRQVFEMGEIYAEVLEKYPKIKQYVTIYHPDAQGPLDTSELMWGGEMFYAIYDEPELVHAFMKLITDTYKTFMDKWFQIFPVRSPYNAHWANMMHRGAIMLRNDSAMNLSPDHYAEFVRPYDSELLDYYGGGAIHFCGRGDHYISCMTQIPRLYGINVSQPHLNDMEKIYSATVDKGIKLLGLNPMFAQRDKNRPGGFHGNLAVG